jgi:hypothetical protein
MTIERTQYATPEAEQIMHPATRTLFRYWEGLRSEQPYPSRLQINLKVLKPVIASLAVLERDFVHNTFKYRLAGTDVEKLFCENLSGRDVLKDWDDFEATLLKRSLDLAASRFQPSLVKMRLKTFENAELAAEMIALPVEQRGTSRVQLICAINCMQDMKHVKHSAIVHRELMNVRNIWTEHQPGDTLLKSIQQSGVPLLRVIEGGLAKRRGV